MNIYIYLSIYIYSYIYIYIYTDIDYLYNPSRRTGKKPTGDNTICRLYQGLRFHSQREDGTNPTSIWHTKRDCRSNNDSL